MFFPFFVLMKSVIETMRLIWGYFNSANCINMFTTQCAVCLLTVLLCWHILIMNRDGCHVDSWQPGNICSSSIMSQFSFFPEQYLASAHIHYIKAIKSERESVFLTEIWVADSTWLHLIPRCFTAVITVANSTLLHNMHPYCSLCFVHGA